MVPINTDPEEVGIYAIQYEWEIEEGMKIVAATCDS
jgi:hypothetical protein